ncbi:hypothetical protein RZS08_08530, partial [Arthrospira platensis SPKY1]|nr:hypothetical protein [Arthrospira platensis SPKY1]
EVDLIAYSAGFPYAVSFASDERAFGLSQDRHRGDAGSLTGMTFFARQVLAQRVDYMGLRANMYFRRPVAMPQVVGEEAEGGGVVLSGNWRFEPTQGFRSRFHWDRGGVSFGWQDHQRYFLSVKLGYTGVRGNSVPEILGYLARAVASDGTHPDGTVYFLENPDIRGQVRRHLFPSAIEALEARGRRGMVLRQGEAGQNGREPRGKTDVIGLV